MLQYVTDECHHAAMLRAANPKGAMNGLLPLLLLITSGGVAPWHIKMLRNVVL